MSVCINFFIDHDYFLEPLQIRNVEWTCPFLPRIGEHVNAWIWIEAKEIKLADVKKLLSSEGEKALREEKLTETFTINDWLYEVGIVCSKVFDISYYKNDKVTPSEIYINMYLNEDGKL